MAPKPLQPEQQEVLESIAAKIGLADFLPAPHQAALTALRSALLKMKEKEMELVADEELARQGGGAAAPLDFNHQLKQLSHGVDSRTLTIFTLANHMSSESLQLGIDPESLFTTFAGLNNPKKTDDLEFARKVMFASVDVAALPPVAGDGTRALRKLTMEQVGISTFYI